MTALVNKAGKKEQKTAVSIPHRQKSKNDKRAGGLKNDPLRQKRSQQ